MRNAPGPAPIPVEAMTHHANIAGAAFPILIMLSLVCAEKKSHPVPDPVRAIRSLSDCC
jgi:hypothetical protein